MKKLSRWMILLGVLVVVGALTAFTLPGESSSSFDTNEYPFWTSFHSAETVDAFSKQQEELSPPTPNRNPCLHCHIVGYEDGPWTPLWRWLSFGTMGLIFLLKKYFSIYPSNEN